VSGLGVNDVEVRSFAESTSLNRDALLVATVPADITDKQGVDLSIALGMFFEQRKDQAKQARDKDE
jgi:hypothetical protein